MVPGDQNATLLSPAMLLHIKNSGDWRRMRNEVHGLLMDRILPQLELDGVSTSSKYERRKVAEQIQATLAGTQVYTTLCGRLDALLAEQLKKAMQDKSESASTNHGAEVCSSLLKCSGYQPFNT